MGTDLVALGIIQSDTGAVPGPRVPDVLGPMSSGAAVPGRNLVEEGIFPAPPPPAAEAPPPYDAGGWVRDIGGFVRDAATGFVKSTADRLRGTAQAVRGAVTGETTPLEYPDMPEITQAPIGFWESFPINMQLGVTTHPQEKARIIQQYFRGPQGQTDPRFGGLSEDKYGHPIVTWGNQPYYVNKPGMTRQDYGDVVAQGLQYYPAGRISGQGRNIPERILRGGSTYTVTDLLQQGAGQMFGASEYTDPARSTITGGFGAALEGASPLVAKALRPAIQPLRRAAGAVGDAVYPRAFPQFRPEMTSRYPLTRGQRTGDPDQLYREDLMRRTGKYGEEAGDTIRSFDEAQTEMIRQDAAALQRDMGTGTGLGAGDDLAAGERLQRRLIDEADARKQAAIDQGRALDDLAGTTSAYVQPFNVAQGIDDMLAIPGEMRILSHQLDRMPHLKGAVDRLRKMRRIMANPRAKKQSIFAIDDYRQSLDIDIGQAGKGSPEGVALIRMKEALDNNVSRIIDDGLLFGDPDLVSALMQRRDLWSHYYKLAGGQKDDPATGLMRRILDENQASPVEVVRFIMGASKVMSTGRSRALVQRLIKQFGKDSEEIRLIKDAILYRTFVSGGRGSDKVTRTAIVNRYTENFKKDGRFLVESIFEPDEIAKMSKFVDDVRPTLPVEQPANPSGTSYTILEALADRGLFARLGRIVSKIPMAQGVGEQFQQGAGKAAAADAISQIEQSIVAPLIRGSIAGSTRSMTSEPEY